MGTYVVYVYINIGYDASACLRLIVYKFKKEEIKYTIVVIMMFVSFTGIINAYSSRELGITYPINFIYCFYMLVGYWIHNNVFKFKEKQAS